MQKPLASRLVVLALSCVLTAAGQAQSAKLTLADALRMAKDHNGQIASARASVRAADARAKQAWGAFLPSITPSVNYSDQKTEALTGFPKGTFVQSGATTQVRGTWQLLDSGERDLNFRSARRSYDAEQLASLQTLRDTLFTVHSQYYEALRSQELLKVTEAQKKRAQDVVAQTKAQIKVGDAAEKDWYQPEADALNAEVDRLSALAQQKKAEANLRATIGLAQADEMPQLETSGEPTEPPAMEDRKTVLAEGMKNRADLQSSRKRLEAQELGLRLTKLNAGITWSVDLSYTKQFSAENLNNRVLGFSASVPLFDGGRSRQQIREGSANLEASRKQLEQNERQAQADIESAYDALQLNYDRVKAAKAALDASRVNYDKVSKANQLGALGADVVAVSTARVSLATAERNYISAIYDYYISDVQLRLVTGRPLPGEE